MAGEIFISYRRSDEAKARLLHALLKQRGVDAWYDAQVGAGEDWRRATAKALNAARIFVLLFSKDASESDDIGKELAAATFSKKLVIPVRIENIKPSGEFLYELASRNWFDAFEDMEVRFEILADKLAALVGGRGEADAAFNLGMKQPAPATKLARRPFLTRPVVLSLVAVALLATIAAIASFTFNRQPGASQVPPQLIAFFGFTPTGDDAALRTTADNATDLMFQAMGLALLNTVARTETRGTPEEKRFSRAAEIGALYTLSGEVRPDKDGMTIAVRFEDVLSRVTLWEKSFNSPASDIAYLPGLVARQTVEVMWCMVKTRSEATRDSNQLRTLIADRCREGAYANSRNADYVVAQMRAITKADPGSAYNQAQLAMMLGLGVAFAPGPAKAGWIAEAEAALKRSIDIDPNEPGAYLARMCIAQAKRVPVAELDAVVRDALGQVEGKDNFVFSQANGIRDSILRSAGRFSDALPHLLLFQANDPLRLPVRVALARAELGQTAEARAEIEVELAASRPQVWGRVIPFAVFLNAADAGAMLRSPPATISQATVDCQREANEAYLSRDSRVRARGAKQASACGNAGALTPQFLLASLAALGDLDGAFALAGRQVYNASTAGAGVMQVMFWPTSRAMRADPRFLPLVEHLGLMDYWRATKSQPDVCETEAAPFCATLKKAKPP